MHEHHELDPPACHTKSKLKERIAAFEQAASDAIDPVVMASKVSSSKSCDRNKYDFSSGLRHDLETTRAALRACCSDDDCCTFGTLFEYTGGEIANLNRILQNLRNADEISFAPECFFAGRHDAETICLQSKFWIESYNVEEHVFRVPQSDEIPAERHGRSYVVENLATRQVHHCRVCAGHVAVEERMTIRAKVFHRRCLHCAVCGTSPKNRSDYVTFDGKLCCGAECVRQYDGAHVQQERN